MLYGNQMLADVIVRLFILLVIIGYLIFLIVDVAMRDPYNLVSFAGMITFMLLMFLYSIDRWHVSLALKA
jgi:hypothetical protein